MHDYCQSADLVRFKPICMFCTLSVITRKVYRIADRSINTWQAEKEKL